VNAAVYISHHGYGHVVRCTQVLNRLPPDWRLFLNTRIPPGFFRQRLERRFTLRKLSLDTGCRQLHSFAVDFPATVRELRRLARRREQDRREEQAFFLKNKIGAVICDSVPLPLGAAREAGLPAALIANFTWEEIYGAYTRKHPAFRQFLPGIREDLAAASLTIVPDLATPLRHCVHKQHCAPIAPRGRDRREELVRYFRIAPGKKLALIYVGHDGARLPWRRLAEFTDWHFFMFEPGGPLLPNFTYVRGGRFRHEEVAASSDAVLGKLGYSLCSSCWLNKTPLLYSRRRDFVEYHYLKKRFSEIGAGVYVPERAFNTLDIGNYLEQAARLPKPNDKRISGNAAAARMIGKLVL
jgi:hypothetical protein